MRLIYPADTFSPKVADEVYADEFAAAQAADLPVSIFSFEDFQSGSFRPRPAIQSGETVLYRGWMLTPTDYTRLFEAIVAAGGTPITDVAAYTLCHHLPGWYPLLTEFTAETMTFSETDDIAAALAAHGWDGCFLKDYVKSLSTDGGSVVRDLSIIPAVITVTQPRWHARLRCRPHAACLGGCDGSLAVRGRHPPRQPAFRPSLKWAFFGRSA